MSGKQPSEPRKDYSNTKSCPLASKNAPVVFQRFMNHILQDVIGQGVVVYLDDILIHAHTREENIWISRRVLKILQDNKLFCKLSKCHFFNNSVDYIGLIIDEEGIHMEKKKVEAVQNWSTPKKVKQLQAFLGFCNFYCCFIPNFTELAKPLNNLTKKEQKWKWEGKEEEAFQKLKKAVTQEPVLAHPDPSKGYVLETDASGTTISVILSQVKEDGFLHPIAYMSKSLDQAQQNYNIFDRELLASIKALTHR